MQDFLICLSFVSLMIPHLLMAAMAILSLYDDKKDDKKDDK